ncbi:lamin tail domain-containing protein [bacterium]|nr:lamin tail domain-containing protein [bacterium]
MGNNGHVLRSGQIISVLLLIASFAFMLPGAADAASLTDQVKKRLCDRQDRLAGRLARALINPSLCEDAPNPTPKPTLTFTANPAEIGEGESSTLSWSTTNATSCTASGGWSGGKNTSGSQSVSPDEDTTYTLNCSGAGGSVSKSVTVSVDEEEPLPTPTLDFDANPTNVTAGGTSTLSWDSTNATACVASNGWSGTKSLDGSQVVTVNATTTYTLACGNGVSTSTESVTVNVVAQPSVSVDISADPTTITEGGSSELTWNSENATSCTASNGWSGSKDLDGTADVSPTVTTTYAIECTGPGGTAQDSVTVTVNEAQDAPDVSISANPTSVTPGAGSATSTLTWTTTDADQCLATGGWSGAKALNGNQIVEPNATTTYSLECSNEAGTSTDSVTVNFVPEAEPEPSLDHIIISEVYDQPDVSHGADTANEWIELYNPTNSIVDLSNWTIKDATTNFDRIPAGTTIAAGGFILLTNASTTFSSFWNIPGGTQVVAFESALGSGLNNSSESLFLRDAATTTVDSLSWGANTDGFVSGNGAVDVLPGHSLVRSNLTVDTGTAADWIDDETPSPGVAN